MEITPNFSKTPPLKNINKETTEKDDSDPPDVTIQETTVEDVSILKDSRTLIAKIITWLDSNYSYSI